MEYKTPTAMGGRGLETLTGTLKPQVNAPTQCGQGNCGECLAFDRDKPNAPGFGYCKLHAPSVTGDEFWPRVRPNDWCLDFVAGNGGGAR